MHTIKKDFWFWRSTSLNCFLNAKAYALGLHTHASHSKQYICLQLFIFSKNNEKGLCQPRLKILNVKLYFCFFLLQMCCQVVKLFNISNFISLNILFFLLFCISCNYCRNNVAIKSFIMHLNIFLFLSKFFPCGLGCWSLSQLHIMLPAHVPSLVHMPAWTESRSLLRLVPHRSEPLQNFVHSLFVYVCMGDARNKEKQALLWKHWMKQQIRRRTEACLRGLLLNYSKVSCVRLFQAIVSSLPAALSVMVHGTIFWIGLAIAHSLTLYFILFAIFHFNRAFWIKTRFLFNQV